MLAGVKSATTLMMMLPGSRGCSSLSWTGHDPFRGGSEARGRGENPGPEQHGGA